MREIKVLQVITGNDNGGGGVHVLNLVSSKVKGMENELCLIGDGDLVEKANKKNIKFNMVGNKLINNELVEVICRNNYDVVNFHGARAAKSYALIKGKIKVPSVITIHSDFNRDFSNYKTIKRYIATYIFKLSLKSFDNFIAVSQNIKELLKSEEYAKDVGIVYNGVDVDEIRSLAKETCEEKIRGSKEEFIFISCARFHPVKNHENLVLAFNELCKKYKNIKLVLIGDGSEYKRIKELTYTLKIEDKVTFLGHIKNPYKYIEKADISILTSLDEGGVPPLSVLEGFALNKTAIISKLPFIENVIDPKNVFLCNQSSVEDIRIAMEKAYDCKWIKSLEEEVSRLVEENFTINEFGERYKNAYTVIIGEDKNEK